MSRSRRDWLRLFLRRCSDHEVTGRAAQLAFYLMLDLFPLLLGLIGILGLLDQDALLPVLQHLLEASLPEPIAELFLEELDRLLGYAGKSSVILGTVLALYYASRAVGAGLRGVHLAFGMSHRNQWVRLRGLGLFAAACWLLGSTTLLLASRVLLWLLDQAGTLPMVPVLPAWAVSLLDIPLMLIIFQQSVNLLYRLGTWGRLAWTWWTPGSLLATGGWWLLSEGYRLYLEHILDLGATYGSLTAATGLLIYLHIVSMLVLVGAELDGLTQEGTP